jgi:hypothetical protein
MRQSAVATIKNFGLVKGFRYNSFVLEPDGKCIADAFIALDKNDSLCKWLSGGSINLDRKEIEFIRPEKLSKIETTLYLHHFRSSDYDGVFPNRRKNLWELFEKNGDYHDLDGKDHVYDIEIAEALEKIKITLQIYYKELTQKIGSNISKINIDKGEVDSAILNYKAKEKSTTMSHPNIQTFLKNVEAKSDPDFIRYLLSIENKLVCIDSNNSIQKGQLYEEARINALPNKAQDFELPKLVQIKQLIGECR